MTRKQVSFPVSDKEHEQIKRLAQKERRTIKLLVLSAFDRSIRDGIGKRKKKKKTAPSSAATLQRA